MSMVEKVARAILNAHAGDIPVHDADLQWSWWIEEARAAIEAMEPTEAMLAAARPIILKDRGSDHNGRTKAGVALDIWQAMKSAALEGDG